MMAVYPELTLDMLGPDAMTEFFKRLDQRKRIVGRGIVKQGIKKATVITYRNRLSRFFEWLKDRGELLENPFAKLSFPAQRDASIQYLRKEEVEKIFTALAFTISWSDSLIKKRNLLLFSTLLYTGLRRGELLGLRLMDLDLEAGLLTVRGETSKSGVSRTLPINSKLMACLKDYLSERQQRHCTTPFLFVSGRRDRGFTADGLKHLVRQVSREVGIPFHLHQFRHTFAVNLLLRGLDISKLKDLLGHRNIVSTVIYLRCLPRTALKKDLEGLRLADLV